MKNEFCSAVVLLGVAMGLGTTDSRADLFDTDAITSGRVPADVSFAKEQSDGSLIRVLREYAPCLKVDIRDKGKWTVTFGEAKVTPGKKCTAALSIAIVPEAGKVKTQDIANFRPENQAQKQESLEGKGYGVLTFYGIGKSGRTRLADVQLSPMPWKIIAATFSVPDGVDRLTAEMTGSGGGIFYVADLAVGQSGTTPTVFLPQSNTLDRIQGLESVEFATFIKEGKPYGFYHPGETISWTVNPPPLAGFQTFTYKIQDPYGKVLVRGEGEFPKTIEYKPQGPGYYELVVRTRSEKIPTQMVCDWQGAGVYSRWPGSRAGGHPFGTQCCPMDLMRMYGASWARGALYGWFDEITQIDANKDYSDMIKQFRDNNILPLHSSNNIAAKSNSVPPGGENELPKDFDAYAQAYKKMVSLGGKFVEHFELWNEPEGRLGANPYWTIENFTKTVLAAHKGMKEANPKAKLAIGSNLELINGVHQNGGKDAYEIMILHPYPWAVGGPWNTPEDGLLLEICASARNWLDANGGKDKEIWSTEYGYTTGTTQCGCSELQQAQMNTRASLLQLAGGLTKINPFRMQDVWFWGQVDGRFGLCKWNMTPKPSMVAYGVLIRAVRDLPFRGRLVTQKNLAALVFGNEKETVVALWTNQGTKPMSLSVPAGSRLMDQFGKVTEIGSGDHTLTVEESVQYVLVPESYRSFTGRQKMSFLAGFQGGIFDSKVKHQETQIPILPTAPVVDGKLDEWTGPGIEMDYPSFNFNATIKAAIHGENLYLMCKIRGESPGKNAYSGGSLWKGDCLELYFTADGKNRPVGYYRETDMHIVVAPGEDGVNGKIANVIAGANPEIPGAAVRYTVDPGGGYDLEAAIPLKFLKVSNPKPGDCFGFDVQVCPGSVKEPYDRRCQIAWNGTGQNYMNPFLWGEAKVVDSSAVTSAPAGYLGWTMGVWPKGLHNTGLMPIVIELDETRWTATFASAANWTKDIYAVVGGWIDNWKTFAWSDGKTLTLGGKQPWESGIAIWKFEAPDGNRFVGGTVSVEAKMVGGTAGQEMKNVFLGIGRKLVLKGGGDYWKGFNDFNADEFEKACFKAGSESQRLSVNIPQGVESFYVAVARTAGAANQLVLRQMQVDAKLANTHGLTVRFDREEPLWSADEKIVLQANATGQPGPQRCWWSLKRRKGPVTRQGISPVASGKAKIDLTGADAGFYTLAVYDSAERAKPLDTQDVVILRAQDPRVTPEDSIFGAMAADVDIAKRMGVKWMVTTYQWAWNQASEKDPIILPNASYFRSYRENGIEPIVLIDTAPGWANGGKAATAPPEPKFYANWIAFNEAVARALAKWVTWFQSWNEPNNPSGMTYDWKNVLAKAKEIQRLQYEGIKRGNPQAKLIGGCFAGCPADWFAKWLQGPDSTLRHQEAMSGHPYCQAFPNEGYEHKRPPELTLIPEILAARKAMDDNGAKDQPLFWTEYGWMADKVAPEAFARWVTRHQIIMQAYKDITKTKADCIFSFGSNTNYCIFAQPLEIKPGGHRFRPVVGAFATTAAMLAGSKPLARISDHPNEVYAYSFLKNDQTIFAAWATEASKTLKIVLPMETPRTMVRVGVMGEESIAVVEPSRPVDLPNNRDPIYLLMHSQPHLYSTTRVLAVDTNIGRDVNADIVLANIGPGKIDYRVTTDAPWLKVANAEGTVTAEKPVTIGIVASAPGSAVETYRARITISGKSSGIAPLVIPVVLQTLTGP